MEWILFLVDFILHIDAHLVELIQNYGTYIYVILFLIIFCETGLVVTPFLPGDSLLFAAGALAINDGLSLPLLFILLTVAAILGDALNYWTGRTFGLKGFSDTGRFLNTKYIEKTNAFYEKHGPSTLVIARFLPIVRTFAPFVAGMGRMDYKRFSTYNVTGAVLWVGICLVAGRLFGGLAIVKDNFSLVVLGIIAVSLIPGTIALIKGLLSKPSQEKPH